MSNYEELLNETAKMLFRELDEREEEVHRMVSQLEVDEANYKNLLVREVVGDITVDAQFAFPPMRNHTPEEVKAKALTIFCKKFERDKRLFSR